MTHLRVFGLRLRALSGKTGAVSAVSQNESGRSAPPSLGPRFGFGRLALAVAIAGLLVAGACGPSVQSIYEGNVRFEHCYRLDLEVDSAPTHREACWKEWLGMYTYGQPRDRIEYARHRVQAFIAGDMNRPTLDFGDDAKKSEARQFYLVVPSPTSGHAPPPPIATRVYADAGSPPSPTTEQAAAPADTCVTACRDAHTQCAHPCDADASPPDPTCKGCDSDYKVCMKRCFQ